MTEKIIGYILIAVGLITIALAVNSVYKVFTGKDQPSNIMDLPAITLDMSSLIGGDISPAQRETINKQNPNLKTELFPAKSLNTPLNLVYHLIFMGFIVTVGFKVASIGTQLARPIKVNLREDKTKEKSTEVAQ